MPKVKRILIIQTAFLGDVVLTLPLAQVARDFLAPATVDLLVIPRAASVVQNHPDLHQVLIYDKRGEDRGWAGFVKMVRRVRRQRYDLALVPHRSLRSALLAFLARIPLRVGFNTSAGCFLFSRRVQHRRGIHEIERNLSLLEAIGVRYNRRELPRLYPSVEDVRRVDRLIIELEIGSADRLIAIAPGTIWNTKRWLKERFAALAALLAQERHEIVLIGGKEDEELCREVQILSGSSAVHTTAGTLTPLQSAELIRRCTLLVTNDSAPMHLAVGVGTPVVAIFGATVPAFGFAPYGEHDAVVETRGLSCRPCSIHGGEKCPIKTFECMNAITPERVAAKVWEVLDRLERS